MDPKNKSNSGLSIEEMNQKTKKQKLSESSQEVIIPMSPSIDVKEAMKKQTHNAMILAKNVIDKEAKNSNLVISPASINFAVNMYVADSKGDLATVEMISFQKYSSMDELKAVCQEISYVCANNNSCENGPKITTVNGFWIDKSLTIDPEFKDLLENFFKAFYAHVDFRSKAEEMRMEVNVWATDHTNGLIKNFLPRGFVTNSTIKIYGNALYFKGSWKIPFEKFKRKNEEFYLLNGNKVYVPFMTNYKRQYVSEYDGFKVLRLPYQKTGDDTKHEFSMYFYLPDMIDGLETLVEKMSSTPGFLDSHIPRYKASVGKFRIPKFKIEFGFSVLSVLDQLGSQAISLYHKACVEIDEEGAKVAAATTTTRTIETCSACRPPPKIIDFVADHLFIFLIRKENTGTVLFVGQIFDPSKSS